jgi:catechol 2,3-dioxygenase-like lactoylglutathione lyase family enzyme
MNMVLEDFDASIRHFQDIYGAEFLMDIPGPEMRAGLLEMGRVILEVFTPSAYLLGARYGAHYLGVEYQADMDVVRAAIAERSIRIVRDINVALHTHPTDTFGIAFEFYAGTFHDRDWPLMKGPMKSAGYWRDEHPLGLTGQHGYTVAVDDIDAASRFFQDFLGGVPVFDEPRKAIGAHAIGLKVADTLVELQTPTSDGELRRHHYRYGDGIRSTIFSVRNLESTKQYLQQQGLTLTSGSTDDAIAVTEDSNRGVRFEFVE